MYLLNAFSANMLADFPASVRFSEVSLQEAQALLHDHIVVSAVGHADTASVFEEVLGRVVTPHRITVELEAGEAAILGQYSGPRLQEGCKTLPEGATIKWLLVEVSNKWNKIDEFEE